MHKMNYVIILLLFPSSKKININFVLYNLQHSLSLYKTHFQYQNRQH